MVEIVHVDFPLKCELMKEAKAFKSKGRLGSNKRSWKPPLAKDLYSLRNWCVMYVVAAAMINVDMMNAR